jgi:transcription initiation factor IIE alpha subunit
MREKDQSSQHNDVPIEEAIKEVSALLRRESELYPSELSERLGIDYDIVVEALSQLRSQGKVA